ncbi:MAG: ArnT family glycosyltransferase [Phycisphaerae bacterium]
MTALPDVPIQPSEGGPPRRHPRWLVLSMATAVWAFALLLRLSFANQVLSHNSADQIVTWHFDSREYVQLGRHLAATGQYGADTPESRFFAMLRTPGYPAIVSLSYRLGWGIPGLVWAQAVLGSLVPLMTFWLARQIFRDLWGPTVAGVFAALSTTGIGLSAMVLADLTFAVLIAAGIALLYAGGAGGKTWAWLLAGLVLGAAILVKPATTYFWPAVALAWWMFSRSENRPIRWHALAWVVASPMLVILAWSARNHAVAGRWVYSTVDAQNLRHFLAPLTEEFARAKGPPPGELLHANHIGAMQRDLGDIMMARITPADLADRQKAEARAIIMKTPFWSATGMLVSAGICFHDGWAWTPDQLKAPTPLRDLIYRQNALQIDLRFPMLGLAIVALIERVLLRRRHKHWLRHTLHLERRAADVDPDDDDVPLAVDRPSPDALRETRDLAALAVMLAYFVLISGTAFSTGFRIVYPAEFALILCAIGGIRSLSRMLLKYVDTR